MKEIELDIDPKIKSKWIVALRSGKFKQGVGFLLEGDRYCCLGVLGIVCGMSLQTLRDRALLNRDDIEGTKYPEQLALFGDAWKYLSFRNDGRTGEGNPLGLHLNFNQIADLIEKL